MGGRKLLVDLVYVRTVVTATFVCDGGRLGTVKIVILTVGARAKEGKRGGGGEKKIRPPDIIVLVGNSIRWQAEPLIGAAKGSRLMPVNHM